MINFTIEAVLALGHFFTFVIGFFILITIEDGSFLQRMLILFISICVIAAAVDCFILEVE